MEWIIYLIFLLIGYNFGRRMVQGNTNTTQPIKKPNLNPLNAFKEHKENKELEKVQKEFDTMWENINTYDGTSNGQKEVG